MISYHRFMPVTTNDKTSEDAATGLSVLIIDNDAPHAEAVAESLMDQELLFLRRLSDRQILERMTMNIIRYHDRAGRREEGEQFQQFKQALDENRGTDHVATELL